MENTRSSISSKPSVEVRSPARPRFRADWHLVGAPAIRAGATGPGGQSVPGCARRGRRRARSHCLTVAIGTAGFTYSARVVTFPGAADPVLALLFCPSGAWEPKSRRGRAGCLLAGVDGLARHTVDELRRSRFAGVLWRNTTALWTRSPRTATGHETPLLRRSFGSPCEVSHTHLVQ
jgi:hypothetical protein